MDFIITFKLSYTGSDTPEHDVLEALDAGADLICENLEAEHGFTWNVKDTEAHTFLNPEDGLWRCKVTLSPSRRMLEVLHSEAWGRLVLHRATIETLDAIAEQAEHHGGAAQTYPITVQIWRAALD